MTMKPVEKRRSLLVLFVFMLGVLVSPNAVGMEDHIFGDKKIGGVSVIRLHRTRGISPPVLKIKPGHTVIWLNEANRLIEIQFIKKQVMMTCDSPVNFVLNIDGTFISNRIPQGAIASICFIERGEFDYSINRVPRRLSAGPQGEVLHGKIIVE